MYDGYMQQRPILVTSEENPNLPLLIVDKKGMMGPLLAKRLQEQFLVVLVSPDLIGVSPSEREKLEVHKNIIHIPYRKKIPVIPDNFYSHTFIIYNGEEEILDMLPSFMKKANETGGKLFFITSLLHSNEILFRHLSHHLYHPMRIVVYGELFDSSHIVERNILNYFISQARTYKRVQIPNSGLGKLYPVLLDDVLVSIIQIAFAVEKKNRIMLVLPQHPINEISAARILQKKDPLLKVDFKIEKKQFLDFYTPPNGSYFFNNYNLEEKLKAINLSDKFSYEPPLQKSIPRPLKRRRKDLFLGVSVVLFCALFLPLLMTTLLGVGGGVALNKSVKEAEGANLSKAHTYASVAKLSFASAEAVSESIGLVGLFARGPSQQLIQSVRVGRRVSTTELEVLDAVELVKKVYEGKSSDPKNDFFHALATFKNSLLTLQQMKAEGALPKAITLKFDELATPLNLFENTVDTYPALLGFEGKKTYLVLFQNNMELRPGGGFIGSYGILQLDLGKVKKFQVHDVYDADGKLSIHIEPPYGLRRYLDASHWFLRDSNFSPDFRQNAQEATRFIQLETGERVDGVVALDTNVLQQILSVLGSVYVPDYKEQVRADNFYLLTQSHAEKDFFPGSTQKKDFLRALSNAIFLNLSEKKNIPYLTLIKQLGQAIREKHLLFASSDVAIQKVLTVNSLSSALWDGRTNDQNSVLDFYGVVDANVGANKANYYVRRSQEQDISLDENGDIKATATIKYENTSKSDSKFGGDYKDYVRFLLPPNATLQSIIIDNQEVSTTTAITDPDVYKRKNFIPPAELEIEKSLEEGKQVIGFFMIVPAKSTKEVSIIYTISQAVNMKNPAFTYDLQIYKQPGTIEDPYSLFFSYPSLFKPVRINGGATDVGGKIAYEGKLSEDKNIQAEFSKK